MDKSPYYDEPQGNPAVVGIAYVAATCLADLYHLYNGDHEGKIGEVRRVTDEIIRLLDTEKL